MALLFIYLPATASVSVDNIRQTIRDYIVSSQPDFKDAEINISFKSLDETLQALKDLKGKIDFRISDPAVSLSGKTTIPIKVFEDSQFLKKIYVRAEIDIFDWVVVAARQIKKGQVLSLADLTLVKGDVSKITHGFSRAAQSLVGKELVTGVKEGTKILNWMVAEVPDIRRGENILIKAQYGGVTVSLMGVALEDGFTGKKIRIRNTGSRKELMGKVAAKNTVLVEVF